MTQLPCSLMRWKANHSILPVTALATLVWTEQAIVISGQGNRLHCYLLADATPICSSDVLNTQAIHGIIVVGSSTCGSASAFHLLVYGGRQIVWTTLTLPGTRCWKSKTSLRIVRSYQLADWVLCGKRSAFDDSTAVLLTAYNTLHVMKIDPAADTAEIRLLNDNLSIFLYSADVLQVNRECFIVAAGTAFGEVLTWLCKLRQSDNLWIAYPWRDYRSHRGSIFGLSISEELFTSSDRSPHRVLVSCSDDRTINVWDLSNIEKCATISTVGKGADQPKSSLFETCFTSIAAAWAHLSRIWNVDVINSIPVGNPSSLLILSTAEDCQAQSWSLNTEHLFSSYTKKQAALCSQHIDRHHAGKNIWARKHFARNESLHLLTGGADGRIVDRSYEASGASDSASKRTAQLFKSITTKTAALNEVQNRVVLKKYLVLGNDHVVATTDDGRLLKTRVCGSAHEWELLYQGSARTPLLVSGNMVPSGLIVFDSANGGLSLVDTSSYTTHAVWQTKPQSVSWINVLAVESPQESSSWTACVALKPHDGKTLKLLWFQFATEVSLASESTLYLPETFDISSAAYNMQIQTLSCGSRSGAIAIYTNVSATSREVRPCLCHRRIHGGDTVTSIACFSRHVKSSERRSSYWLSTGRNGKYCVLRVESSSKDSLSAEAALHVVHEADPPFGPLIEGADLVEGLDGEQNIFLHGFRSKDFVVWDETKQKYVMIIDCGGAHRSWAFRLDHSRMAAGAFAWTKGGAFMYHEQGKPSHTIIEHGGHGREIKAIAARQINKSQWLIATGSEDTDIRLFHYTKNPSERSIWRNVAVIRKHTTGLQDLLFLGDGKTLISAAGMEEMYAWTFSSVPVIGEGVVFSGAVPATEAKSDARIMSLSSCNRSTNFIKDSVESFVLAAALSNGKVRIIDYAPTDQGGGSFAILAQLDLGTICLTQTSILACSPTAYDVLVGATNGSITSCTTNMTFSGNGTIQWSVNYPLAHAPEAVSTTYSIHQNSITAMQTLHLTNQHSLIVAGGDDSSLSLTLMTRFLFDTENPSASSDREPNTAACNPTFRTITIPKAHAAAITALSALTLSSPGTLRFILFSAGNDQRLNLWSITLDSEWYNSITNDSSDPENKTSELGKVMDEMKVELVSEQYTNVADISGMTALSQKWTDHGTVVVETLLVGVGMEILEFEIEC